MCTTRLLILLEYSFQGNNLCAHHVLGLDAAVLLGEICERVGGECVAVAAAPGRGLDWLDRGVHLEVHKGNVQLGRQDLHACTALPFAQRVLFHAQPGARYMIPREQTNSSVQKLTWIETGVGVGNRSEAAGEY